MDRKTFRQLFKTTGPAVLPVIHATDVEQVVRNVRTIVEGRAQGIFLINHDFEHEKLVPIIRRTRATFPSLWLGVNFLGVTGRDAFPILGELEADGCPVDAYWADDARIDERAEIQAEADEIDSVRTESGWSGLYFGGTAFKKQRDVAPEDFARAAEIACRHMDAVTTSGIATGKAADVSKIETFRRACGDHPLTIASGVTPDNIHQYASLVDAILVATGINFDGDFYNTDPARLKRLMTNIQSNTCGET
ncbi:MAG: BtpA/SgcQ family protein [Hyphomicrobiaceae bacterium]